MSLQEIDISWDVLRRIVHEWAGASAELTEVKPLDGGCISTTLRVATAEGARAVLKISPHRVNREYAREAYQLNHLRQLGLPVPEVYVCNVASLDNPDSYLLMQFMEGVDLQHARRECSADHYDHLQMHLAEVVLTMHEQTAGHYHRVDPAREDSFDSWPRFYRHIYDPIWHEVEKMGVLAVKCRKQIGKLHGKLDSLLAHDDRPRLLHWDVWATNILARPDEHGHWWVSAILDPNCKYGHAEAELAYMELFGTATGAFLRAYQQTHRLSAEYHRIRKGVYQVYSLLNHVRLFGAQYAKPLAEALEKVGALV